jgi:hypothetical protein
MERGKQYCCLVLSDSHSDLLPVFTRNEGFEFIDAGNTEEAFSIIRNRFVDYLILPANRRQDSVCDELSAFTAQFPKKPGRAKYPLPLRQPKCTGNHIATVYKSINKTKS